MMHDSRPFTERELLARIAELENQLEGAEQRGALLLEVIATKDAAMKRIAELEAEVARLKLEMKEQAEANAIQCERIADYATDIAQTIRARTV